MDAVPSPKLYILNTKTDFSMKLILDTSIMNNLHIFNSDSEEEDFYGFTNEDLLQDSSEESDISVDEGESSESEDESSESEENDDSNVWSDDLHEVVVQPFDKPTGPVNFLPAEASAIDSFLQVFPEDLLELIVAETNRNADQKQARNGVDKEWTAVNKDDIKAYLAIRFVQGIKSLPSERHYWSKNDILNVPKVQKIMPRNRYDKINHYLHFNDPNTALPREHDDQDKLHHIRPLINRLSQTFLAEYMPNCQNAIDEGLVKFKGRLGFKQYMPMKPIKRGIKVWMRADSVSHFVCKFQVYTGRPKQGQEHGLGERAVKELCNDLIQGNYHLYFDNFFSSFHLMKSLLQDRIYATATTRANRKDFPEEIKRAKLQRGESIVLQKEGVTACAWQDKKKVNFLSTNC